MSRRLDCRGNSAVQFRLAIRSGLAVPSPFGRWVLLRVPRAALVRVFFFFDPSLVWRRSWAIGLPSVGCGLKLFLACPG